MPYQLRFEHLLRYDVSQVGIPVPVTLRANDRMVDIAAKFDAGASDCIFEREHGMALGLSIESGTLKIFGTATGTFPAYGHMVTLSVKDVEYEAIVYFAKDVSFNRNVVGRCGFLDRMLVGLDDYSGRLFLSRNEGRTDED
jgi:hypothetical protein